MFKKIKDCIENVKIILTKMFRIESYLQSIKHKLDSIQTDVTVLQNELVAKKDMKKYEGEEIVNDFKEQIVPLVNKNVLIIEDGEIKGLGEIKSFGVMTTHNYSVAEEDYVITHKKYVAMQNINESEIKVVNITDKTELTLQR